ncbi:MAG: macrolide transporter ATP-binding/permease protein [Verrucomicrobiales bacterium]|nr:macrolide transporter ATP-binding/permease protein [Verrucomicrobiales bacterium]
MLAKNRSFTAIAVLTLALGVGANTAIFSIVDAVLLRPLAYPDSAQLVWLSERGPDWSGGSIAYPNFTDWKNQQSVFETFGVCIGNNFTLTGAGEPLQVAGELLSEDVFTALRTQPEIGRVFRADEDKPGAPPVAVISHTLWQNRFGGTAGILDKTISLNGKSYTVLGVMPAGFEFPNKVDLWLPMGPVSTESNWQKRDYHPGLFGLARLKPGVTLEKARTDLDVIALRLEQQFPESNKTRRVQIDRLLDNKVGNVRRALWILLGAVSFVLVIACANVANLLLARAAVREKEMALRAALGAGQWRITRQLLTESVLLALLGAATGLLFAKGALRVVATTASEIIPRAAEITLDPRVLLVSALVAVLTGILFGLAPAWYARRVNLQGTLKEAGRAATSSRAGLRQGLVIAEVALTFILLTGAGLLLLSFHRLLQVKPGFVTDRVLTFRLNLPGEKYQLVEQEILFCQALREKLRALPGVRAASLASQNSIPLHDGGWDMRFLIEGKPEPLPHLQPSLQFHLIAPDYFRTMGIPLLQGRDFTEQDNRDRLKGVSSGNDWGAGLSSIIIDEEFARRHWPNQSPIGQHVRIPWGDREKQPVVTVVGVVGRIKENRLSEQGGLVQAYFPLYQQPVQNMAAVVKTTTDPVAMLATLRQQVSQLDPTLPIFGIQTMSEMRNHNIAPERLNLGLLGAFAALALILAIIGLYGLLSFTVTQRQREIGVRMALGAQQFDVLNLVVAQGMRLILAGVVIGLLGSFAVTRVLASVLFNVQPTDPITFVTVTFSLCVVALLACYIPARRATKVDPMMALRCE